MKDKHEIMGELEHLATTSKNLHGGNHEEATLRDMGYEKIIIIMTILNRFVRNGPP